MIKRKDHKTRPIFQTEKAMYGLYVIEATIDFDRMGGEKDFQYQIRDRFSSSQVSCPGTHELRTATEAWCKGDWKYHMDLLDFLVRTLGPEKI